ncbi:MAG: bifunctional hydroxymethylpyrimidine kinase/phosphomethylpyrimidine kinase, partial [Clostridiales bacterium]|nr:bifunctional hydroxymethylpyrimidine kinase/phosphomethylpyrimidine kinase [Clostridiales bacterium]
SINGSGKPVAVLVKGGHSICDANDILFDASDRSVRCFNGEKIDNPNTHGTGCTLSSAIASMLSIGEPLPDAVSKAKTYITGALKAGLDLGMGSGPLMHNFALFEDTSAFA